MTETVPKPKSSKKLVVTNLLAMAGVIVVLIILTMVGLKIYTRHGQEIDVPDVKGLSTQQACDVLAKAGLVAEIDDSVYIKTLPPNTVYNQSIAAGSPVKSGRIINLTVNTAQPPKVTMPDIANNCSSREAEMKLSMLGLKVAPLEYVQGEKDWVYNVKVNGNVVGVGSQVAANSVVTLVVGDGTYDMDDVETVEGQSASDSINVFGDDMPLDNGTTHHDNNE